MKNRDIYMSQLMEFKDKKLIKVITGMRRCGKSTLLDLLESELIKNGTASNSIIHINFESMKYDHISDYKILYQYVSERIQPHSKMYIILDEVQQVRAWEKAINSFMVDYDVDIYITGSNAYLLSSELSTLLSGRYVEIRMLPLSFKEFLNFNNFDSQLRIEDKFDQYLKYGGLPGILELNNNEPTINTFLTGIYNTVIMKDVIQRNSVKDISLLENIVKFIIHNIGSIVSPKSISDYINSDGRKTSSDTVDNYLNMLEKAFIIYKVRRYDVKGKQFLKTLGKYYVVDIGIRNALLGYRDADYGHILENIVYFELLRRKYEVSIGKCNDYEIDFVATRQDTKKYYQVALTVAVDTVYDREMRSLQSIKDNYEKTVLSMDRNFIQSQNGIKCQNIIDFLLEE
ncbi:MAG TPA: ATP-binding protein [Ruminiclostridium sp.]